MTESVICSVVSNVLSSVISSAINSLGSLVVDNTSILPEIRQKVDLTGSKLKLIQSWLKDVENKPRRSCLEASSVHQIELLAYRAQDAIEKLVWLQRQQNPAKGISKILPSFQNCEYILTLHEIGAELDEINNQICQISETRTTLSTLIPEEVSSMVGQSGTQWSQDSRIPIRSDENDEMVVGFDSQTAKIIDKLIDHEQEQLRVVSIVGMGGIGKSTLARKIFNDSVIKEYFPINIWIPISREYNVGNIHKKILKGATQINIEDIEKMTDGEVREMLIESLKERRYLIVIDDIWATKSWHEISHGNSVFPDMNNGSRILQTTRKLDVARYTSNDKTYIHEVEFLDNVRSCELLNKIAFSSFETVSERTRKQLKSLGTRLAQKCEGLPLALIVLGGYLSKKPDYKIWSRMARVIDWNDLAGDQISRILALSYDDLPLDLKPTFLYITSFPEGHIIKVSELIKLWIAEGFIPLDQKHTMEERARIFVDQLQERCLVQVVKRSRAHGRITRIRIHDVLRDWGIERARKEGFFNVIKGFDHTNVSYRVAFHGYCVDDLANSMSYLRTLLGFDLPEKEISFSGLKSPRVFRFNPSSVIINDKLPQCIKHMIFLRCICLRNCGNISLPSSIGQLHNLQTLDCRESTINSLPDSLWKISTLRHVHLKDVSCNWNGPRKGSSKNIRSLYLYDGPKKSIDKFLSFKYKGLNGIAEAVEEMKCIVALGLISSAGSLPRNILSKISRLPSLEALDLREEVSQLNQNTSGLSRIPPDYKFPQTLTKIKLGCYNLVDDPMPSLEKLPNLVVLELCNVIRLNSMHCSDTGFPVLQYLTLINFLGEELNAHDGAMLYLCHLKLDGCVKLRRIPRKLREDNNLQRELINGTPNSILAA